MTDGPLLLGFITLQRAWELLVARHNTSRLLAAGGREVCGNQYPWIVALHASWLGTLWLFGWHRSLVLPLVAAYGVLQLGRLWVLWALGGRWTTRVVVVPGETLVARGPYRFMRHPNYVVVALELPCGSLALGLPLHALVFGVLNCAVLAWRIRCEDRALLSD